MAKKTTKKITKKTSKTRKRKAKPHSSGYGVAVTIGAIVVLAIILIVWIRVANDNSKYTYNHFTFEKDGMLWITYAEKEGQPYKIPFYYHPSELEDIVAHQDVEQYLLNFAFNNPNGTVFITLDPDLDSKAVIAAVEISRITGSRYRILNLNTHGALTRPPDDNLANTQSPIVNCVDANNETLVIYLTVSQANFIHLEDQCIVLEGQSTEDLKRVADRFSFMILGIMD